MPPVALVILLLSASIALGGCDNQGSGELLRGPTDGFEIAVHPTRDGMTSFGALVPCAEEAGIHVTGIRPGTVHGRVRIMAWGHRPNPTPEGRDLLGAESSALSDLGFDTSPSVAIANLCGKDGTTGDLHPQQQVELGVQVVSSDVALAQVESLLVDWSSTTSGAHGTLRVPWTFVICGKQRTSQGSSLGC